MEILPLIISAVSVLTAIIALSLNNILASKRDKRKEFRSRLEGILDRIEEIEILATRFHSNLAYSSEMADEIRWRLERLSKYVQSIPYYKNSSNVSKNFNDFKRSITFSNFGSSKFSQKTLSSSEIRDIHGYSDKLTSELIKIYDSYHPLS